MKTIMSGFIRKGAQLYIVLEHVVDTCLLPIPSYLPYSSLRFPPYLILFSALFSFHSFYNSLPSLIENRQVLCKLAHLHSCFGSEWGWAFLRWESFAREVILSFDGEDARDLAITRSDTKLT